MSSQEQAPSGLLRHGSRRGSCGIRTPEKTENTGPAAGHERPHRAMPDQQTLDGCQLRVQSQRNYLEIIT